MALDQQRNWDIAMALNLEKVNLDAREKANKSYIPTSDSVSETERETTIKEWTTEPIYLPDEIIINILGYLAEEKDQKAVQGNVAACCHLSRQWYAAAIPFLYAYPYLYGTNFDPFVRAVCPSINLHVRASPLSELVLELDMSRLVHQAGKSLTARLLGRVKGNLQAFVAPQSSFALNCFPALSKCKELRILDLSLVFGSPPLPDLFRTVSRLLKLRAFRLPRSAGFGTQGPPPDGLPWPPALEDVVLSGGIDGHFSHGIIKFPESMRRMTIEHCPQAKAAAIISLLRTAIRPLPNLETLTIRYVPRLSGHALDDVIAMLPQLTKLSVSVDYITPSAFDSGRLVEMNEGDLLPPESAMYADGLRQSNLRTLELTSSGNVGVEDKISPIDIIIALDEGGLPKLRQVRVARVLHWNTSTTSADAEALADSLQEASKRDWEVHEGLFANMSAPEYAQDNIWEKVAGVWQFD